MKKTIYVLPFLLFFFSGFGQAVDTAAVVREVDSLTTIAWNSTNKNAFDEAIRVGQAALDLSRKALGNQHEWYGTSVFTLGRAYHASAKYESAETLYKEALAIREKIHGQLHMDYGMVLTKIATLYSETGRLKEAEPLLIQALNIPEKVYGKEHRDYVVGLINLGNFYNALSRHEESERLFLEAIEIQKKIMGSDTPEYPATLNNLSLTYQNIGEYEKAEACYLEAIDIRKRAFGTQNAAYAGNISNLSNLLARLGRYKEAIDLLYEAKEIYEKTNNRQSFRYASVINNLGIIYRKTGNFEESERLLLEGKSLKESHTGNQTPEYAVSLSNLGQLYLETGRYEAARQLLTEAKEIREKTLGKDHSLTAVALSRLGQVFYAEKQWKSAEDAFLEAKGIYERNFGKEHPEVATIKNNLARLYFATLNYDKAQLYYKEVVSLNIKLHLKTIRHSSVKEIEAYKKLFLRRLSEYYSFIYAANKVLNVSHGQYYETALFFKGLDLYLSVNRRKLINSDTATQRKVELLLACYRRLGKEYIKPLSEQKHIGELEKESNTLEKELASQTLGAGFSDALRQISWQQVQSALQPHEATLEFIHFNYYNPEPTDSILYAALLLKPGMQHPLFIPLFEEKQIKALLPATDGKLNNDQVNELYGINPQDGQNALYRLLWAPLESHLTGVSTVYCSPSGLLHRLNLAALPLSPRLTLSDRHDLVVLGSTRQLVAESQGALSNEAYSALVYGGIQFNMDSTAYPVQTTDNTGGKRGLSFNQTDSPEASGRGDSWNYLKWSEKEVDNVHSALQQAGVDARAIKGWQATEESFKQIGQAGPSPHILHVSTHGYFFPDPVSSKQSPEDGDAPVFKLSEHPMIRSGLILAGANHAWSRGIGSRPPGNREDGILTAYEISQLDLRNTELVVLSACETGLGHIEGNEGVYGLQRAFKIAGAKTLVMSLWQVRDYQTQELMTAFYQKWLSGKMPVRQALQAAQKEMRDKGYEPYYWAGFVVVE